MATATPSGLDEDPTAYLALPRFNHTLDFELDLPGAESRTATVTYALTAAPSDASWPVVVFINGLGGHHLMAALAEGIAREHDVQILALDRPGCGGSSHGVSIPLASRTRWTHAAHLAVLAHHRISRFALVSHSNGLFYALHTLLHLPPTLTVTSWSLTGPFVPPSISGSPLLRLAAVLPAALPNALGDLMQLAPPVARTVSWSGGLLSASAGLLGAAAVHDDERELRRPPHRRRYLHRSVGVATREAIMARGMKEARLAMGQEALLCLHGSDTVPAAGEGDSDSCWGVGAGATAADVLQGAFGRLADRYPDSALGMHIVYGAEDALVPMKGRRGLKDVLESAGLLQSEDAWREVPEAGHDDILFLDEVMGTILGRVGIQRSE
ncbi:Alpha/Beta hydrolase protein [Mycena polygramma]|nr:Alpha/Beta hydrolase protein [Mycena polygramma]